MDILNSTFRSDDNADKPHVGGGAAVAAAVDEDTRILTEK